MNNALGNAKIKPKAFLKEGFIKKLGYIAVTPSF